MEGLIDGVLPAEPATFHGIHREADRLQRLVDDLQELSRVEAGAFELHIRPVPLSELVQATFARLGRQFEDKDVVLESEISTSLPLVLVDEDGVGQVLLNLVGRALQHTPSGGRVRITATHREGEMYVSMRDTGISIPPEHLKLVFWPLLSRRQVPGASRRW